MAIANRADIKKEKIKTCEEFAALFISIVKRESFSYNEVRIILSSLKTSMQTNGIAVRYKVTDKTNIEHLTTKQFLANTETKNDLSMYLAGKVDIHLSNLDYVVVYGNTCITNMINLNETLFDYNQEEADTGIVFQVFDVSERDPFTNLVISCSDADVLLIHLITFVNAYSKLETTNSSCKQFKEKHANSRRRSMQSSAWFSFIFRV